MAFTNTAWTTAAADSQYQIGSIQRCSISFLLLLVLLSCNPAAIASERDLRIDAVLGAVIDVEGKGSTLWIGTSEGLFKWNNTRQGAPEKNSVLTGDVFDLLLDDTTLWIGSKRGLFRWSTDSQDLPQLIDADTGEAYKLYKLNKTLLIGAEKGLFIWRDVDADSPAPIAVDVSFVTNFFRGKGDQLWIGSRNGVLLYEGGERDPEFIPQLKDIHVTSLHDDDAGLMVGTKQGLLRWDKRASSTPDRILPEVDIQSLYKAGSALLISTNGSGLFRLDTTHAGQPERVDSQIGLIHRYFKNESTLWMGAGMGTEAGLYRWDTQAEEAPKRITAISTGFIHTFHELGGTLWIGAVNGLFRIEGLHTSWDDAQLRITSGPPETFYPGSNQVVRWQVDNFGWRTTPDYIQYRIFLKEATGQVRQPSECVVTGRQECSLPALPEGKYSLYVQATDLHGKTATSPSAYFAVKAPGKEESSWLLTVVLYLLAGLGVALSPRLISILLHFDVWGINHIASAVYLLRPGRWNLYRRYRKRLQRPPEFKQNVKHYVDLPYEVEDQDIEAVPLSDLFSRLSPDRRVIVVADGGRGKSTLCHKLAQRCVVERDLFGGRRLVPVVIDGLAYAGNLLDTITSVLKEGRAYVNTTIVSSQLEASHLLIIFDGFSEIRETHLEAASSGDLPDFVRNHPDTPFIFTSRSMLPYNTQQALGDVLTIRLADLDEATVRPFLGQYLKGGEEEVEALLKEIDEKFPDLPRIPLILKLIANFYDTKGTVPKDTAALFADYVAQLLRPEVIHINDPTGLHYIVRHLVRETYLRRGGDRGFNVHQGVKLLNEIKTAFTDYDIKLSPMGLLLLLIDAGLYKRVGDSLKFFHDSFESYFAACALKDDFDAGQYELLRQCASNDRFRETWKLLCEIFEEAGELQKLAQVVQDGGQIN